MLAKVRSRLTYANLMATIAVFVALGGSAYAIHPGGKDTIDSADIIDGQVLSPDIGPQVVTGFHIADDAVRSLHVLQDTLTADDIAVGAVGRSEIANEAVTSSAVLDQTLTALDIGEGAVFRSELADNAVIESKIADAAVTSAKVRNETLTADDVLNNSLTSADILNNTLTGEDIANDAIGTGELALGAVRTDDVLNQTLTADDIGTGAVGADEVLNESLTRSDVGPNAVGDSELAPGAITPFDFGTIPAARVKTNVNQRASSGSGETLVFGEETFDTGNLHSPFFNPQHLTARIAGVYEVNGEVGWGASGSGDRFFTIRRFSNFEDVAISIVRPPAAGRGARQGASGLVKLAFGESVEIHALQTSGRTLDVGGVLTMHWVGPG